MKISPGFAFLFNTAGSARNCGWFLEKCKEMPPVGIAEKASWGVEDSSCQAIEQHWNIADLSIKLELEEFLGKTTLLHYFLNTVYCILYRKIYAVYYIRKREWDYTQKANSEQIYSDAMRSLMNRVISTLNWCSVKSYIFSSVTFGKRNCNWLRRISAFNSITMSCGILRGQR